MNLSNEEVQAFAEGVKARHGLRALWLFPVHGALRLDMIAVHKGEQKRGKGTAAMREVLAFADAHGARVYLTTGGTDPSFGTTSRARLRRWYKSLGFVMNTGRRKDFTVRSDMYRDPNPMARNPDTSYRISHGAPGPDGAPLHDLTANSVFPPDVYETLRYYQFHASDARGRAQEAEAERILRAARGRPDMPVTIYRSLPRGLTTINPGDWVTIVRDYAIMHGMHDNDETQDWPVVAATVPAGTVHTNGDSLQEWGYNGPTPVQGRVVHGGGRQRRKHNPPRGDSERRRLERLAAQGDLDALARLHAERKRVETYDDQLEEANRQAAAAAEFGKPLMFPDARRWRDLFLEEVLRPSVDPSRVHLQKPPEGWGLAVSGEDVNYTRSGRRRVTRYTSMIGPDMTLPGYVSAWVRARPDVLEAVARNSVIAGPNDSIRFEVVARRSEDAPDTALIVTKNSQIIGGRWLAIMPLMEVPDLSEPERTNPPRGDEHVRALERAAAQGDRAAEAALNVEVARRFGLPGEVFMHLPIEERGGFTVMNYRHAFPNPNWNTSAGWIPDAGVWVSVHALAGPVRRKRVKKPGGGTRTVKIDTVRGWYVDAYAELPDPARTQVWPPRGLFPAPQDAIHWALSVAIPALEERVAEAMP